MKVQRTPDARTILQARDGRWLYIGVGDSGPYVVYRQHLLEVIPDAEEDFHGWSSVVSQRGEPVDYPGTVCETFEEAEAAAQAHAFM